MRALLYDASLLEPDRQPVARFGAWWAHYLRRLKASRPYLVDGSPQLVELSRSVQDTIALLPDPANWSNRPSPYKGLIVGSVQSGKTTNMIGLTAAAIDQGYRIVVVLAGRTEDLRRQTSLRFNRDLMDRSDEIPGARGLTTLGRSPGPGPLGGVSLPYATDAAGYSPLLTAMQVGLSRSEPCVLVIKKWPKSLAHLGSKVLHPLFHQRGAGNLPMLVLDDECDDGSVPAAGDPKDIPELISRLWKRPGHESPPVAYVGYTATAAASLLQDPEQELYPSHFAQLLRHPGHVESPLEYSVANADDWYAGSYTFYEKFGEAAGAEANFLVCPIVPEDEGMHAPSDSDSLKQAVIAYFVSGAYRLALDPAAGFDNPQRSAPTHTMIVQASSSQIDHRRYATAIRDHFSGQEDGDGVTRFAWSAVSHLFEENEQRWRAWHEDFVTSRRRIQRDAPHRPGAANRFVSWDDVKSLLPDAVNNTKLRVVNSDVEVGTSLSFEQPLSSRGDPTFPQDVFTIAVGGGILSRGLTVEGLCISYYTRDVSRPLEDATMQMSRWFGYRGGHLELCRVFTTPSGYFRLRAFHENDAQHRARLAVLMERRERVDQARIALQTLPSALLTAKIGVGKQHDIAFSPFTHVFSRVEVGNLAPANILLAEGLVSQIRERDGVALDFGGGRPRGLVSRGWSAREVADVLDGWSLTNHNPDPLDYPHAHVHRSPDRSRSVGRQSDPRNDPYLVAAYLRWWAANPGDSPPPRFNVGVTFGLLAEGTAPFGFPLLNRAISLDGVMAGGWGGDDKVIDHPPAELIDGAGDRLKGADGLLLLHIVHADATGRSRKGHPRPHHTISFGIAVPEGGRPFTVVVNYDRG